MKKKALSTRVCMVSTMEEDEWNKVPLIPLGNCDTKEKRSRRRKKKKKKGKSKLGGQMENLQGKDQRSWKKVKWPDWPREAWAKSLSCGRYLPSLSWQHIFGKFTTATDLTGVKWRWMWKHRAQTYTGAFVGRQPTHIICFSLRNLNFRLVAFWIF